MSRKLALLIGNTNYKDPTLRQLVNPDADVNRLAKVLSDPKIGGFAEAKMLLNESESVLRREIARFFVGKNREDLLLLYFSGHGILDGQGLLHLAVHDTEKDLLSATAVSASFVRDEMNNSFSRRQVLILDCCHSGAFMRRAKRGESVNTGAQFDPQGYGRFVMTASDALQYAFEGDQLTGSANNSIFTHFLIEGLTTGAADLDGDDRISVDEWYEYVSRSVLDADLKVKQTPCKFADEQKDKVIIALNPRSQTKAALPDDLLQLLASKSVNIREAATRELGDLLKSEDKTMRGLALESLKQLANNSHERVANSAKEILIREGFLKPSTESTRTPPPKPDPATPKLTTQPANNQTTQLPTTIRIENPFPPLDLILIPAGEFLMGSDKAKDKNARDDELPQHKILLPDYYITKYLVTNAQWAVYAKAMNKKIETPKGKETHPVFNVNWNEANEFCGWLQQQDLRVSDLRVLAQRPVAERSGLELGDLKGLKVRLPTEVEWEKAARGSDGRIYPWGNEFDAEKCNVREPGISGTTPVGKYSPQGDSSYGISDMSGNVWEWTSSKKEKYPYKNDQREDGKDDRFVLRGGAWGNGEVVARCAYRGDDHRDDQSNLLGFRVVVAFPVSRS